MPSPAPERFGAEFYRRFYLDPKTRVVTRAEMTRRADLIAAFVVNRFRGDPSLFDEGVRFLEERTRRPVLGVLPYDPSLRLPAEDSLNRADLGEGPLRVAVVALPHLANAHVLLVDDIRTTGATLHAAAQALRRGGAASVSALVLARTPAPGEYDSW